MCVCVRVRVCVLCLSDHLQLLCCVLKCDPWNALPEWSLFNKMHKHTHTHTQTHTLTDLHTRTHTHTFTHSLSHTLSRTHTYIHTYTLTHSLTRSLTHTHTHTHTNTHTHAHTQLYVSTLLPFLSCELRLRVQALVVLFKLLEEGEVLEEVGPWFV